MQSKIIDFIDKHVEPEGLRNFLYVLFGLGIIAEWIIFGPDGERHSW